MANLKHVERTVVVDSGSYPAVVRVGYDSSGRAALEIIISGKVEILPLFLDNSAVADIMKTYVKCLNAQYYPPES